MLGIYQSGLESVPPDTVNLLRTHCDDDGINAAWSIWISNFSSTCAAQGVPNCWRFPALWSRGSSWTWCIENQLRRPCRSAFCTLVCVLLSRTSHPVQRLDEAIAGCAFWKQKMDLLFRPKSIRTISGAFGIN